MERLPAKSSLLRARTVQQDWVAWLPPEKDALFASACEQLESSYTMLSVALDEALARRGEGLLMAAREHVGVSAALFDRLATQLRAGLRAMEGHGRHFGTLPNVAPLNPEFFRGPTAQRIARKSNMLGILLFSSRSKFFHKLHSLIEIVEELLEEYHSASADISESGAVRSGSDWETLEVLHYDFNTCLRETIVVLKSFLCAVPNDQVQPFRQRWQAGELADRRRAAREPAAVRHRRASQL